MEMESVLCSDVFTLERMFASVVVQTAVIAANSLISLLMAMESLTNDVLLSPKALGTDERFPFADLHKVKKPDTKNTDGSDTEDDDDEDDDDNTGEGDDDDDEDFAGEEGNDDDDEEGDPEDDVDANGAGGNDDDEEEADDDDDDEDEDGEDDEDEDEDDEDDEETPQPPAKKRK